MRLLSSSSAGRDLAARLRARRTEIEEAILGRAQAVSSSGAMSDPQYAEGLREAVSVAIDHGLIGVERGEERAPPIPIALLSQARLAARKGVGLDAVLRCYFGVHALLSDFAIEEAEREGVPAASLKRVLRSLASVFDCVLAAVSEEHKREAGTRLDSAERRRAQRVERLLDGELLDTSDIGYELEGYHLGMIAKGPGVAQALRELARFLDRRLLLISRQDQTAWAWLGGHRPVDHEDLGRLSSRMPSQIVLAHGEPARGPAGWRLTHRQAAAALPIALRGPEPAVRYADVVLLASIVQDDLLVTSLRRIYLEPLERERDGGEVLRATLYAYFAADRNVSSTAAALGIRRHTVASRLASVEDRIDRQLSSCTVELELSLRLEKLGAAKPGRQRDRHSTMLDGRAAQVC